MSEFRILSKQIIGQDIKRIDVFSPFIAKRSQPGQYALVMPDEKSMRIALPIVEKNTEKQTITFVFKEDNPLLELLGRRWINDELHAVIGPLGKVDEICENQTVACVGHGLGIASVLPFCRALRKKDNKVIGIIGEKTNKKVVFESQMRLSCHKFSLMVEDGSSGKKGTIQDAFQEIISTQDISLVYAAGPVDILEAICETTRMKKIKTKVILPALTIDGIGISGCGYLNTLNGYFSLAVDGPAVDAEEVDFDYLKTTIEKFSKTVF